MLIEKSNKFTLILTLLLTLGIWVLSSQVAMAAYYIEIFNATNETATLGNVELYDKNGKILVENFEDLDRYTPRMGRKMSASWKDYIPFKQATGATVILTNSTQYIKIPVIFDPETITYKQQKITLNGKEITITVRIEPESKYQLAAKGSYRVYIY